MKKMIKKIKGLPHVVDSHLDTHYRIGMRVIKTGAAVMICLLIALLTGNKESIPITAVSAIVTIRATQGETVSSGIFRVLGTVIGGALGILTVLIRLYLPYYNEGLYVIVIPLVLLLNLYLCNVLKMQDSCTISCVVTILIAAPLTHDETINNAFIYTLIRLRDTLIGVVVATVMNIVPYQIISHWKTKRIAKSKH